jgi:hypothetical protein
MKKLLIVGTIACVGLLVFNGQQRRRVLIEKQNTQLASMAATLKKRSEENARRQAAAEARLHSLETELPIQETSQTDTSRNEIARDVPVPPDPSHQGGWPKEVDYFYLPKAFLQQASFQVMNEQRLTEETAKLYNLSEPERVEVDRAIGDLFAQLRSAESERMELVDLPDEWCHGQFASGIAYHIPAFSEDVVAWRRELQRRLEATLGEERSSLLGQEIDEYLRAEWNDLGEGERTVGFVWHPEANGSQSIWYAIKDQRHGAGTFRRHLPGGDTDSSFAHYAELFGVELPKTPF